MKNSPLLYTLIAPDRYLPFMADLKERLPLLLDNRVTYNKEIHLDSRFAICHYKITYQNSDYFLHYDAEKSKTTSNEKKSNTDPILLNCASIQSTIKQFLHEIGDPTLTKVEVKLIQTEVFPFIFNPHRDSQFWRLRHIKYLATVLVSSSGISGGNMQLFHSEKDQQGPFTVIETVPTLPGTGYIVYEPPHKIFHGMKPAIKTEDGAHRGALLLRFFE